MTAGRHKGLHFYKRRKKISSSLVREIFIWLFGMVASVFVAFVLIYFAGMTTSIIGVSMEPTVYNGQKAMINRFAYVLASPQIGDVVVFLPNGNHNSHYYVKRVVGEPGDMVQIKGGRLFINGEQVQEEYDKMADAGIAGSGFVLGNDEYFVLGDNRNNSEDSRSANIGPVKETDIVGKAWFRLQGGDSGMGFIK